MNLDYFIQAANILLLVAYTVGDILWVRLLAVASSLNAVFPSSADTPLGSLQLECPVHRDPTSSRTWRLLLERRPVKLTAEGEQVRQFAFRELDSTND